MSMISKYKGIVGLVVGTLLVPHTIALAATDTKVQPGDMCKMHHTSVEAFYLGVLYMLQEDSLVSCPIIRDQNLDPITDLDVIVGSVENEDACALYSHTLYGSLVDSELTTVNGTGDQVLDFDTVDEPGSQGFYSLLCGMSENAKIYAIRYVEGT